MPSVGSAIYLNLQLFDGATNQFPRAYLYDAAGDELAESPVDLAHVENGLYSNSDVLMPASGQIKAVYKVFTDSGHTTLSGVYAQALDIFTLDAEAASVPSMSDLVGVISSQVLQGTVSEQVLLGTIGD